MTQHGNTTQFEMDTYEIRIEGHVEHRWEGWFEGLTIEQEAGGTTKLSGDLPDQTALHSVLQQLRDMNLKIISVHQIDSEISK